MPLSNPTPVLVLPDTFEGRKECERHIREGMSSKEVRLCPQYKEDTNVNTDQYARLRGLDVCKVKSWEIRNVCENRDLTGDRRYQHCFHCPAGFMFWSPPDERNRNVGQDAPTATRIRVA